MVGLESDVPETHVLAIASHVTSGYVGNTMATFCMQALGCEVSAINTVNYSNHVGYGRFKGRKTSSEEVKELYEALKDAGLQDFDVMLSGYCPSASLVEEVGRIARERKLSGKVRPGSFFWVLDPVMGDNGRIYVADETVPVYKSLLKDADLILPNQFEAELLTDVKIYDIKTLSQAITELHRNHRVPHILITSVKLSETHGNDLTKDVLSVVGSTATSDLKPRLFRITVPSLPVFYSGTGDMLAALLVARLRQVALQADLLTTASWWSSDEVAALDLPLAKATEKVLASMHAILKDTAQHYKDVERKLEESAGSQSTTEDAKTQRHLRLTRAAEVRVVRNADLLRDPPELDRFKAELVEADRKADVQ